MLALLALHFEVVKPPDVPSDATEVALVVKCTCGVTLLLWISVDIALGRHPQFCPLS